jgi:hypothetical protein
MGIRYYAYPVAAVHAELARIAPHTLMSDDPLVDAWGPESERPAMLYLDKCWGYLQRLFDAKDDRPARPAFDLVKGKVVMTATGWESVIRALDPDQVVIVAKDLETVTADDVWEMLDDGSLQFSDDRAEEFDYIMWNLDAAKAFTARLAREGLGLVYLIG